MSRIADKPIAIPAGVNVVVHEQCVQVKGPKGQLQYCMPKAFVLDVDDKQFSLKQKEGSVCFRFNVPFDVLGGTTRANLHNMVVGVSQGYEKILELVGIGYRGQVQGKLLNLTLGFSHPVVFNIPEGVTLEMPSQTEIVIKGIDKQLVGQVAANICTLRHVDPYKGKGVRYKGQRVILKETKKK